MRVSIYLHRDIVETLKMFGDLSTVVNRVLAELYEDRGLTDYPKCVDRQGAARYEVDVTDENYLRAYTLYGPSSPRASLRRILYYFVNNEIYAELGWEAVNEYDNKNKNRIRKKLADICDICNKIDLQYDFLDEYMDKIRGIVQDAIKEFDL